MERFVGFASFEPGISLRSDPVSDSALPMNPFFSKITRDRWRRFKQIKRGYYSLIVVLALIFAGFFLELTVNDKALMVRYEGEYHFPVFKEEIMPGTFFGLDYEFETNYRELQAKFAEEGGEDAVWMPWVPYDALENDIAVDKLPPPRAPSLEEEHYLGTDVNGRDVLARLLYGFRVSIWFALGLYVCVTLLGVAVGALMGYFGGTFDMIVQRLVEIWSALPSLYMIIILSALITPTPVFLLLIFVLLGWTGMTWLIRAEVMREKNRQYCEAARSMGAGNARVIFKHLLPHSLVPVVSLLPFQMVSGISALTGLDYLGYGLQPPTPSWGEMLKQGQSHFEYAPWILLSPTVATIVVLLLFTFIGEAARESLNPRQVNLYDA